MMNRKEIKGRLVRAIPRRVTAAALQTMEHVPGLAEVANLGLGIFRGELRATVAGMRRHQDEVRSGDGAAARTKLRRCVHRLEKGLIMRPRRDVFGLDYIADAVAMYTHVAHQAPDEDRALILHWAHDVLTAYFTAAGAHPTIDAARLAFEAIADPRGPTDHQASPYARDLSTASAVTIDALADLAHRRRSVRWFEPRPVPRALVDQALMVARQSPSACNRQPFELRIYDDEPLVRALSACPMGTTGLHENFPMIVLWVGQMSAFAHHRDRHVPYIDASQAAMAFQFALETLGLSSCCINWPDLPKRERRLRRIIQLGDDERVIMFMAVGYPDHSGEVPFSQKKSLDALRSYNKP